MTDPIIPTRIITAGEQLPAPMAPPPPPPPPVQPPRPVWPDPPTPGPVEVRVTFDIIQPTPEPAPEPRDWSWLWRWLRPVQTVLTFALATLPFFDGASLISAWSATLAECRAEASISGAYVLAGVGLTVALILDARTRRWWARLLLVTALVGGTGAIGWFDVITIVTGVTRP